MQYNYVAIEGNIGSGKTSLSRMISEEFNAKLILERFEDNSFLPKFYKNPEQYAFPLEMSFLADRYQQLKETLSSQELFKSFTIADYFIDKSLIFARQNLKNDEFLLYSRLFDIINASLPKPEIIVFLYTSIDQLQKNISKRGREYELEIKSEYLEKIQRGYFDYFNQQKSRCFLVIDTRDIDFVGSKHDYEKIKSCIFKPYSPGIHRITF